MIRVVRAIAAVLLAAAFLVPIDSAIVGERADAATCASANITVTPLSGTIFYADFSPSPPTLPNLAGHYTGYKVTNATGATLGSPYVRLSGFTGGVVGLASGESSSQPLGSLAAGAANTSYFYLSASSATAVSQTHTVSVYDRNPSLTGAIELCNTSATFTSVTGTTQAAANKVTIATATSNPPGLGAIMTMTVQGDTGTIGSGSAGDPKGWDMTPAAVASGTSAWNPGAYRLTAAKVNIDLDGTGATDWPDYLHRTFTDPSGSARSYTITYTFVIVGTTSASTALSPIQYIASGTQIKHTDMSGSTYSAILPIQPISNTTTIAKTASPTSLTTPGGTVGYTVTATNSSGTQSATLDDFTDTPGAGATYVAGSSKFNGVTISDPVTSGSTLVWSGSFVVPAGTSRSLTYSMTIVSGVGTVSNSVIGHIGATVIDTTTSTADNVPATRSVTVAAAPTLNLTKSVGSRLSASDQFTVAIKNGASTVASATTSGAGTTASTGAQTLAAGTAYSLTDAMAAGSVNAIGNYVGTISCTNSASGSTTVLPTGSSAPFSLTPAAGDVIACSISNAPVPTVTLLKSVSGRIVSADQFTVAVKNGAVTVVSATTSGAGSSATTGSTAVTAGTVYTLTDVMAAGSTSAISQYTSQLACTNTASGSATVLPSGTGTSFTLTPSVGDAITCTYTNTAPAPRLTLVKSLSSRHDSADQFTVAIKHGAGPIVDASHTTSGVLLGGSTAATTLTAGTVYTLTDDVTAGSSTNADYSSSISCTNSTAGTGTTLPSGLGNSFSITAAAGDVITCTFDNRAKPRVTLLKSVGGRVSAADQFTVAITHGAVTDASATTTGAAVSATTGVVDLSNGTPYTLTDAMAAGSSSALSAYLSSISCTNTRSGSTTVLPSGSGTTFSLNPAFDDQITCTITNTAKPHLTLIKSVGSRAAVADQFTVAIKNGASTVASATTAGVAASATTGITTVTTATTYTLTDTMAAGSASVIGQYASSISCSNAKAGSVTVLPSGTGTSFSVTPTNGDVITCTITNTAGTATLGMTKTSPSTNVVLGNVITYTYGVTNAGSLPLTNVGVTDPMAGLSAITCAPAQGSTLASGATMSCSATYTVTQADVDAGSIINTGTVTGTDPSNNTITKTASKTVTAAQSSSLSLTKAAVPASGVTAGSVVAYTLSGKNTGTTTLHNVTVTDPLVGTLSCTPSTPATLAPNATISCTGNYTVTQANVDAGSFLNTATIGGLTSANNPVSATGTKTVTATQTSTVGLTKTASPSTGVVAGTVVTYTFTGTNTGTVTLHNVGVTDPMSGLSALSCTPSAPATLAPNATITCTATYTVTQANVDAGSYANTATINALNPSSATVTNNATKTVTASTTSTLGLTKTAAPSTGVVAGSVVAYTITGTNTGVTTLHNVTVSDPLVGTLSCTPATPATLAPNAIITCTGNYTVTQANVDAGSFLNTATTNGLSPTNAPVTNTATKTVTATQTSTLGLTKTAAPNTGVVAGSVVTYTYAGTNTGTVTLHNVGVTDPMSGLSAITCTPSAPATLAPNATISCTATYTVTQADVDAGSILNTATLAGLNPANTPVTTNAGTTVTANQTSTLGLTKTASPSTNVVAGTVVTYTFAGRNTGTTTLHNVGVTDPMSGLSAITCTPAAPATLAPNATITCTATYTVTQANVDTSATITNHATIDGLDPFGNPASNFADAVITTNQTPALAITKTASPNANVVAGDTVTYQFAVSNPGTVTMNNVTVTDPLPGLGAITCSPTAPATLAPAATMNCSALSTVTQADVDAGSIMNTATVAGDDPIGAPITNTGGTTVTADQAASLSLTKTAVPNSNVVAGDVVTYTFTGTNTGTVTLHGFSVADPLPGLSPITCPPGAVAPLSIISCTATYTVTQADVDAGSILNTATMSADDPSNNPTTATAGTTVTAGQTPALTLTKSASPNANVVAGTVVTYAFAGQNSGNVTLHNVTVTDPMAGLSAISCSPAAPATLAPNATINCTATYTVTQVDVDAGQVVNTATVTGLAPSNQTLTNTAGATVTADQTASISLTKAATPTSGLFVGNTVSYTMTATNTGAVSVHNVVITDPMVGLSVLTCTPAAGFTLAANASMTCTGTYTVTQNDVDAGSISNTATVDALDVSNAPVTATTSKTILAGQTSSLALVKTPTPSTGVVTGDTITYGFDVTNNGTVSVHNVSVADPMTGLSALTCGPVAPATLAPNATMHCDATYTVTQTNVNDGSFTNTATVTGLDTVNNPVSDADSATVTTISTTSVNLTKRVSPDQNVGLGTLLTYTMTATNTGTTTLENARIIDPMTGLSALTCTPAAGADLAPGASITCTATYTVTAADVTAGEILNDATVSGHNLNGQTVTHAAAATVPTASNAPAGGLTIDKKLMGVTDSVATWTITVANSGAATYPGPFTVTDALPTDLSYESVSGTGWNCTGTTTITCVHAADLAAGASTTITVKTKIVGEKEITNVASLDVAGRVLTSKASFQPGSGFAFTGGGFAFTGSDAQRLGFLGLLGVLGGWFIMVAARKRTDDEADIVV